MHGPRRLSGGGEGGELAGTGRLDKKDGKLGQEGRNILESSPDAMCPGTSARRLFGGKSALLAWRIDSHCQGPASQSWASF